MKIRHAILGITAGTALFLTSGCSKQEQPPAETPKAMNPAPSEAQTPAEPAKAAPEQVRPAAAPAATASQAVSTAASEVQKAAEASKPAAQEAQATAMQAVQTAATQAVTVATAAVASAASTTQVQALIDKAKNLTANQKYQDALTVVQQLYSMKLTPEQQTLVDGLKAQIQSAMAKATVTNATSVLGNVLGGKK